MKDDELERLERLHLEEALRIGKQPPVPPLPRPTIHYTELPEDTSNQPSAKEWNFYRREVGRLLAEGHEGRWVLIKCEAIIGIWDSRDEAKAVALERYLMQPVLIHEVLTREPVLRGPTYFRLCRS
jgi:hypothetical protein